MPIENQFGFVPKDYATAGTEDFGDLATLAKHPSSYIRAAVARNKHADMPIRMMLADDASPGVIFWLIQNPSLTLTEYERLFRQYAKDRSAMIQEALVSARFATFAYLETLAFKSWVVDMAILDVCATRLEESNCLLLLKEYVAWANEHESRLEQYKRASQLLQKVKRRNDH